MKVADLEGAQLDYWVAKAEGHALSPEWDSAADGGILIGTGAGDLQRFAPSTDWADGGPIIEREQIYLIRSVGAFDIWLAAANVIWFADHDDFEPGDTALIAAMRAYVASKFGDEVPDENI